MPLRLLKESGPSEATKRGTGEMQREGRATLDTYALLLLERLHSHCRHRSHCGQRTRLQCNRPSFGWRVFELILQLFRMEIAWENPIGSGEDLPSPLAWRFFRSAGIGGEGARVGGVAAPAFTQRPDPVAQPCQTSMPLEYRFSASADTGGTRP